MLDRIVDALLAAVSSVPAWMVGEDSPNFLLIQTMFAVAASHYRVRHLHEAGSRRCGALHEKHVALFQGQGMSVRNSHAFAC
jgi:hypothetical protein